MAAHYDQLSGFDDIAAGSPDIAGSVHGSMALPDGRHSFIRHPSAHSIFLRSEVLRGGNHSERYQRVIVLDKNGIPGGRRTVSVLPILKTQFFREVMHQVAR